MPQPTHGPVRDITPKPSPGAAKAPTREALLAALAERERRLVEAQERREHARRDVAGGARKRQTVTSEVLRVISQSRSDARPVFESIVCAAARLLRCDMAFVLLRDGDAYIHTAGATPEGPLADLAPDRMPIDPDANFPSRAFLTKSELHLPDWSQTTFRTRMPHSREVRRQLGVVPAAAARRRVHRPLALAGSRPDMFGPSQIAQAGSFRDQALIAIENRPVQRDTGGAGAAEGVGGGPGRDQQIRRGSTPVLEQFSTPAGACWGTTRPASTRSATTTWCAWRRGAAPGPRKSATTSPRRAKALPAGSSGNAGVHHIPDLRAEPNLSPDGSRSVDRLGSASLLYAPMLWEDRGLGSILVVRSPPRPFSEREHALLQSFADQAAIAIQNARLFHARRRRRCSSTKRPRPTC